MVSIKILNYFNNFSKSFNAYVFVIKLILKCVGLKNIFIEYFILLINDILLKLNEDKTMKRFLLIFAIIFLVFLPCFANDKCLGLVEQVEKTNNPDIAIKALECNIKTKKKDLSEQERIDFENVCRGNIVKICAKRYELSQDKKYIKKATKYAFEAIENKTKDIETIQSAIVLAAVNLDINSMIKAYDYLSAVNPKIAESAKNDFLALKDKVNEKKQHLANMRLQRFYLTTQVFQQTTNKLQRDNYLYNRSNNVNTYTITPMGDSLYIKQW